MIIKNLVRKYIFMFSIYINICKYFKFIFTGNNFYKYTNKIFKDIVKKVDNKNIILKNYDTDNIGNYICVDNTGYIDNYIECIIYTN
jgi:hypothetical protein